MWIVEVVKTRGNFQLKGESYFYAYSKSEDEIEKKYTDKKLFKKN